MSHEKRKKTFCSQVLPFLGSEICFIMSISSPIFQKAQMAKKQECTDFPTPFQVPYYALSQGVFHFVKIVIFENLVMEVSDWLLKFFHQ